MLSVIGKKVGMTAIFSEDGKKQPCTVVSCEPNVVTQIKTEETDGYSSIQIASIEKREKSSNRPEMGHFAKAKTTPKRMVLEVRDYDGELALGDSFGVEVFSEGEFVDVVGTSKGKGFQGVVKRHGFSGVGEATHGQHNRLRAPGSLGAGSTPSRVFKGTRMAGQMGNERVKIQNLRVLKVDADNSLLVISGAIPGHKGSYVVIEK
ncbi:MAG: 50S ribosomal protein L3 [Bacteroidetes bacterium]|jgi:large subunit ribosomal protein L3|nr:50S ribosomal protein L3 [Bacteroidota bacterium]MDA8930478.1 50S ribosomal protein L3 [Bacteroidia bacterium]